MNRRGFDFILLFATIIVVCAGMHLAAPILVPLLLAGFITTVSLPLVALMHKRGIPKSAGISIVLFVDMLVVVGLGWLMVGSIRAFYARLPKYREQLEGITLELTTRLQIMGIDTSEIFVELGDPSNLFSTAGSLLSGFAGVLSNLLLVIAIVAFMLVEATGFREKLRRVLPAEDFKRTQKTSSEIQKYLGVKTLSSLITGIVASVYCFIWGVDLPFLWGALAFLLNFIPTIGSFIAAVPPIILALLQFGPGAALGVTIGYVIFNVSIATVLEPRIMGKTLGLSPLIVFLSMIFWGWLLGPAGALLSVPLTVIIRILLENTEDLRWFATLISPLKDAATEQEKDLAASS